MRLHRLVLTNVRGVTHRDIAIDPRLPVLIEGPNEVGKTTMIEALDILFDYKHTSRDLRVRSLQPVERDVPSVIEAEISTGPYHFRYSKQFNRDPSASLHLFAPQRHHYRGSAAHEHVCDILQETLDRQLWKSLRILQADPLTPLDLGECPTLLSALSRAAELDSATTDSETLLAAIAGEYHEHFSPTGRPRGAYRASAERLSRARENCERTQGILEEYDAAVAEHHELLATISAQETAREAAVKTWEDHRSHYNSICHVADELCRAQEHLDKAQAQESSATARWKERDARISEAADATAQADAYHRQASEASKDLESAQKELDVAQEQARQARRRREEVQPQLAQCEADLAYCQRSAEWKQERERLATAQDVQARIRTLHQKLTCLTVGEKALEMLEQLERTRATAALALESGNGVFDIDGGQDGLKVSYGGRFLTVPAGQTMTVPLTECLEYLAPSGARLSFHPAPETQQRQQELEQAGRELDNTLTELGVSTVAQAREAAIDRQRITHELQALEHRLGALLEKDSVEELARRVMDHQCALEQYRQSRASADTLPTDLASAQARHEQALTALSSATADEKETDETVLLLRQKVHKLALRVATSTSTAEAKADEAARLTERLSAERAGVSDTHLYQVAQEAIDQLGQARARYTQLEQEHSAARLEEIEHLMESAHDEVARLSRELDGQRDRAYLLQARIDVESSGGHYATAQAALKDRHDALAEYERLTEKAESAKLLYETVNAHREGLREQYRGPLQEHVQRLGRVVFGEDFAVELDSALAIASRTINEVTVPYASLSFGAKEQLGLLLRLACAALVDAEEGVPLIIDDALGHSDPERLERISDLLRRGSPHCQIIVLTCFPDRYRSLDWPTIRLQG